MKKKLGSESVSTLMKVTPAAASGEECTTTKPVLSTTTAAVI